jgi:hypothetical protein
VDGSEEAVGFVSRRNCDGAIAAGDFWVCFAPARWGGAIWHRLARAWMGGVLSVECAPGEVSLVEVSFAPGEKKAWIASLQSCLSGVPLKVAGATHGQVARATILFLRIRASFTKG